MASAPEKQPGAIYLIREVFALADSDVRHALDEPVRMLKDRFGSRLREVSLCEILGEETTGFATWSETYSVLQWAEIGSCAVDLVSLVERWVIRASGR